MADSKSYMICRTAPIFNDLELPLPPISRSRHYLMLNIWETVRNTDSFNGILGTYTTLLKVSFRMTSSDLAKYSMARSVGRCLCDSWASCFHCLQMVSANSYVLFILPPLGQTGQRRHIMFSGNPFVRLLPNLWTRYFENNEPILIRDIFVTKTKMKTKIITVLFTRMRIFLSWIKTKTKRNKYLSEFNERN